MSGTDIVTAVLQILFSGFTTTATSFGAAISSMVTGLVFTGTGENQTLSPFFILTVVFAGVSLSLSLVRWVLNFATSWGNRNR